MESELSQFQIKQLTSGGSCEIHSHRVDLREHRHVDTLQSLEVVRNVSANYDASYKDDIIIVDTTAGNVTVTLPTARGGKIFTVVKAKAANTLTISFSNGESMLGALFVTLTDFASTKRLKSIPNGYIPL